MIEEQNPYPREGTIAPFSQPPEASPYVINCAGEKVPVGGKSFTSRCAVGNTDDYLAAMGSFVSPKLLGLGKSPEINIVIPSYNSGLELAKTLLSLLSQRYLDRTDIIVLINEPAGVADEIKQANDRNEEFIQALVKKDWKNFIARYPQWARPLKDLSYAWQAQKKHLRLTALRETLAGGLPAVYQMVVASFVGRVRRFCDAATEDRALKARLIQKHACRSFLLICDDDLEFKEDDAIQRAYRYALGNNAVVLGRQELAGVQLKSGSHYLLNKALRLTMQIFLDLKQDRGMNFLPPRGMLMVQALEVASVKIGETFGEQLYFARLASQHPRYFIDVRATIGETNYPGNGKFLKDLAGYLQGENNEALKIFENVLQVYKEGTRQGRYTTSDGKAFLDSLKTRDPKTISMTAREIRKR